MAYTLRLESYPLQDIQELGENSRVEQLARQYRAQWIYFDERTFPLATHELKIDEIRRNPRIRLVLRRNTVQIFEINAA